MPQAVDQAGARRALIVLLVVVFVNIAGFGVVIPLLPFYGKAFGASPLQISLMFSAFAVGQLVAEAFLGPALRPPRAEASAYRHHLRHRGFLHGAGLRAQHHRRLRPAPGRRPDERKHIDHPGLSRRRDAGGQAARQDGNPRRPPSAWAS